MKTIKLAEEVNKWWEEHKFDVIVTDEDEYNVYNEMPEFVKIAQEILMGENENVC